MISINILNYSKYKSDDEIKNHIENFKEYLIQSGVKGDKIKFVYNDTKSREEVYSIICKCNQKEPLFSNDNFWIEISPFVSNDRKMALIGEELSTNQPWGEAIEEITIIKNLNEKNIWHEIAHLIGAKDHYDKNFQSIAKCQDKKCIMQRGKTEGVLCSESLNEIKNYINSNCR